MTEQVRPQGALYVVATPIGNLRDIGQRALDVLAQADAVFAEDTRHSAALLAHHGIRRKLLALHEHNERSRIAAVLSRVAAGETVALISDAGTPLLCDPGFPLVREARARGLPVLAVPGPSAALAALSVSGLPVDRFVFEGFLPARRGPRRARLAALAREPRTMVFYEAPHRLSATLADMREVFGAARRAVLARELTKIHESVRAGGLGRLCEELAQDADMGRGEQVILVEGVAEAEEEPVGERQAQALLRALLPELPLRRVVDLVAGVSGVARNRVYRLALDIGARDRRAE